MLREMAEALGALTVEAPLVMVLEDLHWSDAATVDLVSLLARRTQPARLLLIGTYRPGDRIVRRHPLEQVKLELQAAGRCHELSLTLLGEAAVADYLRERFAHNTFPPDLAQIINRRTEGNPLFMVSVVDDLVGRGLIAMRDDRWELHAGLQEVEVSVPESLRQMIERRITQLGDEERQILAAGSVAGMDFSAASVAAALERPPSEVEERCDELARRQLFIRSLGAREWPDRSVSSCYGFMHALHRRALYEASRHHGGGTAPGDRPAGGDRPWRSGPVTSPAGWPRHFEQAGDDRRAVRYLAEAAETARRRHTPTPRRSGTSRTPSIAGACRTASGSPRGWLCSSSSDFYAAPWATCAIRSTISPRAPGTRGARPRRREVRALLEWAASSPGWIATAAWRRSRSPGPGATTARRRVAGPCPRVSHAFHRILLHGWRDEDAETCRLSLEILRRVGERRHLSLHVGRYAYLQSHRSEYRAACRTAEEGLRLAVEVSDAYHYMAAQFHRAWALLHLGEWGELHRVLRDGLEMAERNGHDLWAQTFRFQMAWLLTHVGDFARARALCERERQPGGEAQLGAFLGSIALGFAELGSGRYAAALRAFEEVTGPPQKGRLALMDWILHMPVRLGLGQYWLARRQFGRAREQMQELCRLAAAPAERTYLALGHRGLAEATLAEGDRAKAEREVAEALGVLDNRAPLAEWRVCATAARSDSARPAAESGGLLSRARAWIGWRPPLKDDGDPYRSFLAKPEVEAVRRNAKLTADTAPPRTGAPSGRVGQRSGSSHRPRRPS
jgi:tetratricopeptide (TPR) repeat protein